MPQAIARYCRKPLQGMCCKSLQTRKYSQKVSRLACARRHTHIHAQKYTLLCTHTFVHAHIYTHTHTHASTHCTHREKEANVGTPWSSSEPSMRSPRRNSDSWNCKHVCVCVCVCCVNVCVCARKHHVLDVKQCALDVCKNKSGERKATTCWSGKTNVRIAGEHKIWLSKNGEHKVMIRFMKMVN